MAQIPYSAIDRRLGAYIGAAIGDAVGAPIEGDHWELIRERHGRVDRLLPATQKLNPSYMRQTAPGGVTDDTFIRDDFTRFVFKHPQQDERTLPVLIEWLIWNADWRGWWHPPIDHFEHVRSGKLGYEDGGEKEPVYGRAGCWTAFGLLHAGDPAGAAAEVMHLGKPWKSPLERYLSAAVQAGAARAMVPGARWEQVIEEMRAFAGPRGTALIDRAIAVAERHVAKHDLYGFCEEIYATCLINFGTFDGAADGPLPPPSVAKYDTYAARVYTASALFAEQVPLAAAAFVYGRGAFLPSVIAGTALGRDNDSICTSLMTWVGGLCGLSGIPTDWSDTVIRVNRRDLDLLGDAWRLAMMGEAG